jgi:uncharacterized protein YjbJ (UPF0337 family)
MEDKIDKASGKAKEAAGKATGDDELADQGRGDQAKADAKDAVKTAGDKLGDATDKVKGMFKK